MLKRYTHTHTYEDGHHDVIAIAQKVSNIQQQKLYTYSLKIQHLLKMEHMNVI